jgi:deazaflavin-dependent oxidoreductase (nitroreductase family)
VGITNSLVAAVLRSPLHRLLSGSTALIRYTGRRSGREFVTPVQFARAGEELVILVGRPGDKTWWHNFEEERSVDILLARRWIPMSGKTVDRGDPPGEIDPLIAAYLTRFPRAARITGDGSPDQPVVVVHCRRRDEQVSV